MYSEYTNTHNTPYIVKKSPISIMQLFRCFHFPYNIDKSYITTMIITIKLIHADTNIDCRNTFSYQTHQQMPICQLLCTKS